MSVSTVVTYGFGTFGSVNLISTYGFGPFGVIVTIPVVDYYVSLNINSTIDFSLKVNTGIQFGVDV